MLQLVHFWQSLLPTLLLMHAITVDALILPSAFHQRPFTYKSIHHYDNTAQIHTQTNHHGRTTCTSLLVHTAQRNRNKSTALFGIPKMFRWLTDQYPNINSRLNEGLGSDKVVDNFYLDMNGIIHPCTHGNNQDEIVVLDETAMFKKIFGYVDRYVF
jgi:hypothetical protein